MVHQLQFSAIQVVLLAVLIPSIASNGQAQSPETIDAERRARRAEFFRETLESRERRERQAEFFSKKPVPANDKQTSVGVATVRDAVAPTVTTIAKKSDYEGRWVVFVIPGTYSNAGAWFHVQPGMATFSSEVQTALGSNTVMCKKVWQSSVHHDVREKAASQLVDLIGENSLPSDRVVLIGHSHGGNVALLAASQCKRQIHAVICLSTPNVYYTMQQTDARDKVRSYPLPVYCTPATCKNVGRIVTVTPQSDNVPDLYAELRKGIDANDALHATRHWQDSLKTLSLRDDNGPFRELVDDVLETKRVNHISVSSHLNVAHGNIVYPSAILDELLVHAPHQAVHSRRMGAVIGWAIKRDFDNESTAYLQTVTQHPGCDFGEPIPDKDHRAWELQHALDFKHSGWYLTESIVKSSFAWDRTKHLIPSAPDPYFTVGADGSPTVLYKSSVAVNMSSATWSSTTCVVPRNTKCVFKVYESNPGENQFVGSAELSAGPNGPPTDLKGEGWSATLKWARVHE